MKLYHLTYYAIKTVLVIYVHVCMYVRTYIKTTHVATYYLCYFLKGSVFKAYSGEKQRE